jgi:uncharacterized protein
MAAVNGLEALAVVAAGMGAGAINSIVGSGTLISFPTLLAVGYPSVTANVSNNIGLIPGSMAGVWGFRRELAGQGRRARTLATCSAGGALVGAVLLLTLPSSVFDAVIPALVLLAAFLMAISPWLSRWVAGRRKDGARDVGAMPMTITFVAGIYGGYFGAAQGIILLAMLSVFVPDDLRRSNALKNLLAGTVNAVAGVFFVIFADVSWEAVGLIAVGATVGGLLGARVGRWIDPAVLRVLVVIYAVVIAIRLIVT